MNNVTMVETNAAQFLIEQRNVGFAQNDGRWIVSQLPELYWSTAGALRQSRPGAFLGVFDTRADADIAISTATQQSVEDSMVGRVI